MEQQKSNKKIRFSVIDIFIVIILLLCVVGIGLRFVFSLNKNEDESFAHVESEQYYVSYIARNQRNVVPDYLAEGNEFRFYSSNDTFGESHGKLTVTAAMKRYYNYKGKQVIVYNTSEDDRSDRVDIQGMFLVTGRMNDNGILLIDDSNGNTIALNQELRLRSDLLTFTSVVTGISKVS